MTLTEGSMSRIGKPLMWPSDSLPSGALALDGSTLNSTTYYKLYSIYGRKFTSSDTPSGHFSVPDMRGRVVRGVDMGAGRDTGASNRARLDGAEGDTVGSIQSDSLKGHMHLILSGDANGKGGINRRADEGGFHSTPHRGNYANPKVVSSETRCDNIYMTFITFYE